MTHLAMDNLNLSVCSQSTLSLPVGKKKKIQKIVTANENEQCFFFRTYNRPNRLDYFYSLGYKDISWYTVKHIGPIHTLRRKYSVANTVPELKFVV
jgi:hypothetical protein